MECCCVEKKEKCKCEDRDTCDEEVKKTCNCSKCKQSDGMVLLKEFFSGPEGLKRSSAFIRFANMLASKDSDSGNSFNFVQTAASTQVPEDLSNVQEHEESAS